MSTTLQNSNVTRDNNTWDYNLDYKGTYKIINTEIIQLRKDLNAGDISRKNITQFSNLIIGLVQLRNGCRVSEAIQALKIYCRQDNRTCEVKVAKREDNYYRKMVLPEAISSHDLAYISTHVSNFKKRKIRNIVSCVSQYFQKTFNFSTHALRYSFISYLSANQEPAQIIARVTGHKSINLILHYTSKKIADQVLLSDNFERNLT